MIQADASIDYTMDVDIQSTHLPYFLRSRVQRANTLKLLIIAEAGAEPNLVGEPVVLNGDAAANVVLATDAGVGVPSAVFPGGVDMGPQLLQFTPAVVAQVEEIKDIFLVLMLDVV